MGEAVETLLAYLKDPIWVITEIIYILGVLTVIFAATNFLHGFAQKDTPAIKVGVIALVIGLVLLVPHVVYIRM